MLPPASICYLSGCFSRFYELVGKIEGNRTGDILGGLLANAKGEATKWGPLDLDAAPQ